MKRFFAVCLALLLPAIASGHEVYVLDPATIAGDIARPSPSPLEAFFGNESLFFFWGFVCFVGFSTIFFMSIFHRLEVASAPLFARLKKYAAPTARVTLGVTLVACAYNGALFGPELPFDSFGYFAPPLFTALLFASGILITLGLYARIGVLLLIPVFLIALIDKGTYMGTYANYFGEAFFVLLSGAGLYSIRDASPLRSLRPLVKRLERYAWPVLRISFGFSVTFAAVYAKFIHSNLALDTIAKYDLTKFFHFDPLFTVLGAFIIESLIGIFYILGLEIRWNAIFFLFWLGLSLLYFGEAVWPHLVLIGLNIAFFLHGYDRYSIEGRLFKKRLIEPVL